MLHEPNPLNQSDLVIRSSAVSETDPRLIPFKKNALPIFRRGSFIARFCRSKRVVAIAVAMEKLPPRECSSGH